jgi:hypothetical protein
MAAAKRLARYGRCFRLSLAKTQSILRKHSSSCLGVRLATLTFRELFSFVFIFELWSRHCLPCRRVEVPRWSQHQTRQGRYFSRNRLDHLFFKVARMKLYGDRPGSTMELKYRSQMDHLSPITIAAGCSIGCSDRRRGLPKITICYRFPQEYRSAPKLRQNLNSWTNFTANFGLFNRPN